MKIRAATFIIGLFGLACLNGAFAAGPGDIGNSAVGGSGSIRLSEGLSGELISVLRQSEKEGKSIAHSGGRNGHISVKDVSIDCYVSDEDGKPECVITERD
ncbi:MAG: hypothetical protein ACXVBE_11660 [Bdellovibrionota bacterium]